MLYASELQQCKLAIMDDVFAAVDPAVAHAMFQQGVLKILADKARILVLSSRVDALLVIRLTLL